MITGVKVGNIFVILLCKVDGLSDTLLQNNDDLLSRAIQGLVDRFCA